jgi:gamma-glutamylcyclotransferase (GGCT)/AIG2-like uncharacterized protein YtfP
VEDRLFVYGTLRPGHAPPEIADAVARLRPIGPGTVRGHLHNLGAYPGLILDASAPSVPGQVFAVPDAPTLARMDSYEGYDPANPDESLFLRVQVAIVLDTGAETVCWIYTYNRPIPASSS